MLRLGQDRLIRGRKGETSRGLRYLDCTKCGKTLQRARGCHRFGQSHRGPEWRIDFTGDIAADTVRWCPASALDVIHPSFFGAMSRSMQVESAGGALSCFGTPLYLLPSYWVTFFELSIAARDRFLRELEDAYHEVM